MKLRYKILLSILTIAVIAVISFVAYIKINPSIPVVCYHNIATAEEKEQFPDEKDWIITVENFEEHLKYLQKFGYKTLTTEEFYKWKNGEIKLPYRSILITFDDGFLSNAHYAFPLLKKYNMNATVFVAGEFIENSTETEWTGNVKTYMTKEMLENIKIEYPNIEICSHSYLLHKEGSINQEAEILTNDAKQFREKITDTSIYCYPFGQYNDKMIQALKDSNYKMAFKYGPDYKKATKNDNIYEIPRLNASHGMNVWKFIIRLLMPY